MTTLSRPLYRHSDLSRLFNPQSVAIVGASPNEQALGYRTAWHLKSFSGKVMLVNPKYDRIGDNPCYPSIGSLPEVPDCVVIATPRETVELTVKQCCEHGVGGAVIYASGYAETGLPDRIAEQARLADIGRESGLKILGPNCLGFVNFARNLVVQFSRGPISTINNQGGVAVVSQSGAVGFALSQGARRGVGVSHVIASGNSCVLDVADQISYLADEPQCRSIVCVLEGLAEPARMIEAGEIAWAANKPLIVCKLGTGEKGARAALSHSGSLAGSLEAYRAAFDRAGIIMLNDLDALMETAAFFAKVPPRPSSHGVGIVALSGGAAVSATDKAELHGIALPDPLPETRKGLLGHIPEFGSPRNPCDTTAMAGGRPEIVYGACDVMSRDPQYGAIVLPQTSASPDSGERLKVNAELCAAQGKPLIVPWLSGWLEGHGAHDAELHPNIALFYSVDRCFAALSAWHERDARHALIEKTGRRTPRRHSDSSVSETARVKIRNSVTRTLTERESKAVLRDYGVRFVEEQLARSQEEAIAFAESLGYPVALKVESPAIPHKTEAGVVRLNLKSRAEVAAAYSEVLRNARRAVAKTLVNGVLVQPMVRGGAEIMVGARIDPMFGPLIVVGAGGTLVELLDDKSVELAPVTHDEALAMLGKLKTKALLSGFRGSDPVELGILADTIVRVGEFVSDQRDVISELDINPLICSGTNITAVDALIIKAEAR